MKTQIIVCCHRESPVIKNDEIHFPVHVGKALSGLELGFSGDDTGDNISDKNKTYCELTGQYWAWKNLNDADYIGLAHYRRYFSGINSSEQVDQFLRKKYDIILLDRAYEICSNRLRFEQLTTMEDMAILLEIIQKHYPDYYPAAVDYLCNSNRWVRCNMFIMNKENFHNYSKWLFEVLEKTEEHSILSGYSRIRRIFGYMGEILLGIYVKHHAMRIKYVTAEEYISEKPSSQKGWKQYIRKRYPDFWSKYVIYYRKVFYVKRSLGFSLTNTKTNTAFIQPDVKSALKNDGINL